VGVDVKLVERFWAQVDLSGGTMSCWPWTGRTFPFGYGRFVIKGKTHSAHRWLISTLLGRSLFWTPENRETVCHKCDNPPCCNPSHLYIGSPQDNIRDREERGRSGSGKVNAAKTHCPLGHEYTESNTLVKRGSRNCRACASKRTRDWYQRHKESLGRGWVQ
jgi:HNH endonuclease